MLRVCRTCACICVCAGGIREKDKRDMRGALVARSQQQGGRSTACPGRPCVRMENGRRALYPGRAVGPAWVAEKPAFQAAAFPRPCFPLRRLPPLVRSHGVPGRPTHAGFRPLAFEERLLLSPSQSPFPLLQLARWFHDAPGGWGPRFGQRWLPGLACWACLPRGRLPRGGSCFPIMEVGNLTRAGEWSFQFPWAELGPLRLGEFHQI